MKKYLLVYVLASTGSAFVQAQKISADLVPPAVTSSFKSKFPKIEDVHWEMEKGNRYESNFKVNGTAKSATFDKSGSWLETETEIKQSELPDAVRQAVEKKFSGYTIREVSDVDDAKSGKCYEVEINKEKQTYDVRLSPAGEILSREAAKGDKEDKK